ncbi:MAG: hypothetical protein KatS3mg076_0548 [Candidatus Binatia bacterium]|nr:MAG: hypothetical protein KatS3mg076_0548 [Candidatus Binatia bacterium]
MTGSAPAPRAWFLASLLLLLGAFGVRAFRVGEPSLSEWEIAYVSSAREGRPAAVRVAPLPPRISPLVFLVELPFTERGLEEAWVRLPFVLAGTGAVLATLALAEIGVVGRGPALLAGALVAFCPPFVEDARRVDAAAATGLFLVWFWASAWAFVRGSRGLGEVVGAALALVAGRFFFLAFVLPLALLACVAGLRQAESRARAGRVLAAASGVTLLGVLGALALAGRFSPRTMFSPPSWRTGPELYFLAASALGGFFLARSGERTWLLGCLLPAFVGFLRWPSRTVGAESAAPFVLLAVPAGLFLWRVGSLLARRARLFAPLAAATSVVVLGTWWLRAFPPAVGGRTGPDWRAAAAVITPNLAPDALVLAPLAARGLLFYAPELERRMGSRPGLPPHKEAARLVPAERAWVVVSDRSRLHPGWAALESRLRTRVVVDLSPAESPEVYYVTQLVGRKSTYSEVSYFELPPSVLARTTLLRDLLRELGPEPAVRRQVGRLLEWGGALRNPSLEEAAVLLEEAGWVEEARRLRAMLAARGAKRIARR